VRFVLCQEASHMTGEIVTVAGAPTKRAGGVTGDSLDARRAYALALVNEVVPADQVLDTALALAERIARNGPLAPRAIKELVRLAATSAEA
jgi:enoyl-CoA hydratase/carnithine racemase